MYFQSNMTMVSLRSGTLFNGIVISWSFDLKCNEFEMNLFYVSFNVYKVIVNEKHGYGIKWVQNPVYDSLSSD